MVICEISFRGLRECSLTESTRKRPQVFDNPSKYESLGSRKAFRGEEGMYRRDFNSELLIKTHFSPRLISLLIDIKPKVNTLCHHPSTILFQSFLFLFNRARRKNDHKCVVTYTEVQPRNKSVEMTISTMQKSYEPPDTCFKEIIKVSNMVSSSSSSWFYQLNGQQNSKGMLESKSLYFMYYKYIREEKYISPFLHIIEGNSNHTFF